jgi:hypothetical protein
MISAASGRLERSGLPLGLGTGRLNVVMAIEHHRRRSLDHSATTENGR